MKIGTLFRYMFPPLGARKSRDLYKGDVVFAQAFGRNTFPDSSVFAVGVMFDEFEDDEKTLEWLKSHDFDPGIPNKEIAKVTKELMTRYFIPAVVQWEVAAAFDTEWYLQNKKRIVCIWPTKEQNTYFNTNEVITLSLQAAEKLGRSNPIEVAHKMQILRAALIIKKLSGKFPLIPDDLPKSFDRKSFQWWTRTIWACLFREIPVRIHHIITKRV